MGIISNCASLFIKPISDDLGVSRRAVSSTISVLSIGAMITSLFAGRLFNDHNIVSIMRVAIIVMTICFFCNSLFTDIQAFYITAAINGICQIMLTTMPITFILNNWFKTDVGTALGFASMGSGLGGAFFNAVAGKRIELYGWRMTYRILSVVIFVLAVPCIFFLIKRKPEEKGCFPYEKGGKNTGKEEIPVSSNAGVTFEEAKNMLDEGGCIMFDVRTDEEFFTGHAEGAVNFDVDTINAETAAELIPNKDTPIIVYCKTGERAKLAAEALCELGYTNVYDVGSLVEWPYGLSFE